MNIYEIEEYAEDKGYDSLKFKMKNIFNKEFEGQFVDAYFGFINVPEIGDGIIRLSSLIKEFGSDFFTFEVIE